MTNNPKPIRTAVVTGANSGLGLATARGMAQQGFRTVLLCRNAERAEAARVDVEAAVPGAAVEIQLGDLASQASTRVAAAELLERFESIDVLINNAGIEIRKPEKSVDDIDLMLAVNHLGPFLLTNLLVDRMRASVPARIVNVSSAAHKWSKLRLDDLQATRGYGIAGMPRYGETKLMNILFTRELARRLAGSGVTVNCVHPGAVRTNLGRSATLQLMNAVVGRFVRTPDEGARTALSAATDPRWSNVSGSYFANSQPADNKLSAAAKNDDLAARLWAASAALVDLDGRTPSSSP